MLGHTSHTRLPCRSLPSCMHGLQRHLVPSCSNPPLGLTISSVAHGSLITPRWQPKKDARCGCYTESFSSGPSKPSARHKRQQLNSQQQDGPAGPTTGDSSTPASSITPRRRRRSRSSSGSSAGSNSRSKQPQLQAAEQPQPHHQQPQDQQQQQQQQQQQTSATGPQQQQQQQKVQQPEQISQLAYATPATSHKSTTGAVHLSQRPTTGSNGSGNGNGSNNTGQVLSSAAYASIHGEEECLYDDEGIRGLVHGATVRFSDSPALRLRRRAMVVWEETGPQRVLIVKKPVPAAAAQLEEMAVWLEQRGLQVFVERAVHDQEFPQFSPFDPATTQVDFAITLGGDGTVLYLASLFEEDVPLPPVMCFAMGTLGFLTPFDAGQYRSCLSRVLAANCQPLYCTLRTRKRCAVMDPDSKQLRVYHILNECVVDRGAFPSSVYLEIYIDGSFVTAAEADGVIVATPSGSTAYSMSAGGSIVAPSVPCTLLTPLSPHSLSFRPLIIPENADLTVRLPHNARSHARASFDGKHPMRIQRGGSVHFQPSLCPLPLINIGTLDTDFYEGITQKLKWNQSIRGVPGLSPNIEVQVASSALN